MIKVNIYRNSDFVISGFELSGHAGCGEEGEDIICSAVSILVINTINSIEKFTKVKFEVDTDEEKGGYIRFEAPRFNLGETDHDAELLLEAMLLGLRNIEKEYSQYMKICDKGGTV
ncbi:MAG: ribosomal-processing cysteine protease Prp [Clostridia bacterium]|jgi:uncharacterized protein YsxB (DUF464 family)|nr:ribosomal-processing cysteine protease Prp [Clostridia bacterium]